MIDSRDTNDYNILTNLKNGQSNTQLININNIIFNTKKVIIYTPSLGIGGGNKFIINMYIVLKSFGYIVNIIPINNEDTNIKINKNDIKQKMDDNNYDYIVFNSDIPNNLNIKELNGKIFFITHSDVAYANYFIEKYHHYFYKIITVNEYTKNKLSNMLQINENKFFKIINYSEINNINKNNNKNYKFGVISRFSEDKNIPMLILSLVDVFKKHTNYKCYLVGTHTPKYDDYLKHLCKLYNISKNIIFEGYQEDVLKYYEIFDFIILPSVSEGCSYNIIEAMNIGLPIITSNVGGNHELIKNNVNGIIYDYTNIRDYEKTKIYITNYNEHLNKIGYIMPDFNEKSELFNINKNTITKSILEMINFTDEHLNIIKNNNKEFINNYFNQTIYIKQLYDLFCII